MVELNDRELASVILLTVSVIGVVLTSKDRGELRYAFTGVVRSFFVWKIQLPFLMYLAYTCLAVTIAASIGLWKLELLKETFLIVCSVVIPMLFSANKVSRSSMAPQLTPSCAPTTSPTGGAFSGSAKS
jgi:hypothetical protein